MSFRKFLFIFLFFVFCAAFAVWGVVGKFLSAACSVSVVGVSVGVGKLFFKNSSALGFFGFVCC